MSTHTPLHQLHPLTSAQTGGRLDRRDNTWFLANAHAEIVLELRPEHRLRVREGDLVRVHGGFDGATLAVDGLEVVHHPGPDASDKQLGGDAISLGDALRARAALNSQVRTFFAKRGFLEVETPAWVESPGTDIYLNPFSAEFVQEVGESSGNLGGYLHTSPEFAMKRLLSEGLERIFQLTHVWRNGEVTSLHNPEFTILEWYRAWEEVDVIIDEVEALTRLLLAPNPALDVSRPFLRMTMQEVVDKSCGFDLLEALNVNDLRAACQKHNLMSRSMQSATRWDELFFELVVTYIDPMLAGLGAVFVTEWPAPLAVLARRKASDPRVAERFELYVNGIELANGFGELTDPDEQRARFDADLRERRDLGLPELPMPEAFLAALRRGMPPASGVAMGVDRLLMLAMGAAEIADVLPFAQRRGSELHPFT